ncbi:MAG: DUF4198 domain-containing protein [Planctomycetes bacterium]|nr:DUF4198 domain-containing protein [Planctomycetota bacterium]
MRILVLLLPGVSLLAIGCSAADSQVVVPQPVTGKVVYDGQPAAGVRVTLIPTDAPTVPRIPHNPYGVAGADGTFSLTTFQEGDGAAEGDYQIVLSWPAEQTKKSEREEVEDPDRLLGWYDPTHSKLSLRVTAGQNVVPLIKLPKVSQPPPISQGVPGRN